MSWSCLSLSCHCITLASSTSPESNHTGRTKSPNRSKQKQLSEHQKQLSIMEMERAIGAGNQPRDLDKNKIVFNGILPDFSGMFEGPLEKQIRHTGEWVATTTEQGIRSSRKGILMVVMQWILPIWTLSLLLASGAVKLPFSTPLLDNLIM
ncbi:hypothetical protein Dsin_009109 [Dipteronia sinensis]|uniref:Chlororespiratory reduction 3 n=1 Tax=Dipteronia sinensis TaxID=43782 RepID=A0AAE0EBL1_9ROSI|nr:hypothetical protein Dsin_009109 [Dipteronia sinensis]